METKFKVGDIVEAFGCKGYVSSVSTEEYDNFPLKVILNEGEISQIYFTRDGRSNTWHKAPSLKLIERPKKKAKKTVERYMIVFSNGNVGTSTFTDNDIKSEGFQMNLRDSGAQLVKLTGEYEIEED